MIKTQISEFVKDADAMRLFQQERLILDVTEHICEKMESGDMNRVQLASALGKSKGYVSQLLDGSANMTLRTMSDVFLALGLTACIRTRALDECFEPRLTLVHDEAVVWGWKNHLKQEATQQPLPVSGGGFDSDGIAA